MGVSPKQYVIELRINKSKQLLLDREMKVSEECKEKRELLFLTVNEISGIRYLIAKSFWNIGRKPKKRCLI